MMIPLISRLPLLAGLLLIAICGALATPVVEAKTWALKGGTIHPVEGEPIAAGTILFDESGILAMGVGVEIPADATVVDTSGKQIYPGLIAAHSQIGLIEIPAVRATVDTAEAGRFNPNAAAHKAFNPDSEVIPVTRSNGVLVALVAPSGGLLSGQASLMRLSGWTWEEMLLEPSVGLVTNWPSARRSTEGLTELKTLFDQARAYLATRAASPETTPIDLRLEAMKPILDGERPLLVAADGLAEIEAAVAFATWQQVKLVILGGYDAPLCAPLLKEHDVPVIVSSIHRLTRRRNDPYDAPYTLPERLRAAGLSYCIAGDGRFASNVRNLPYHAATAVAYGLPADEALKAITLYPAQIFGVDDRVGSLKVGKEATLFVTDGDPLETPTQILDAYVAGKPVELSDRHKELYEKFRQRIE